MTMDCGVLKKQFAKFTGKLLYKRLFFCYFSLLYDDSTYIFAASQLISCCDF